MKGEAGIPFARAITLEDAAAAFYDERESSWSDGWAATVEGVFAYRVIPYFGPDRVLSTIVRIEAEGFQRWLRTQKTIHAKKPKTLKAASVNRAMAALAAFGTWAAHPDRKYLLENVFAKIPPLAEDERAPPKLDAAELARFLAELPPSLRDLIAFAVDTGLRKSELGRLQRTEIDLKGRRGWVVSSWARGLTKGKVTRPFALTQRCVEIVRRLPERGDGLLFGPVGDRRRALRSAAARAGIGTAWFHAARHWGATFVGEAGATLAEMMGWGGWADTRMVKRYTHADHRRLLAIADKLDANVAAAYQPPGEPRATPSTPETPKRA